MVVQVFARENGTYISSVLPRDTLDEVFRLLSNVERSDVKRTWSSMENTATPERGIYIKLQNGSEILLKSTDKAGQYAIQFDWDTSRNYKGRYRVVLPDAQNFIEQQIAGGNMT